MYADGEMAETLAEFIHVELMADAISVTGSNLVIVGQMLIHLPEIVFLRERLVFLPFVVYMFSFICFELYYFTDYRSTVNPYFYEGISDAMDHIKNDLPEDSPVYVAPSISYSNILFYDKTDLDTYLNTVSYANYPAEFLSLNSFGRYVFGIYPDQAPDEGSIYLLDASYDNSPLVLSMTDAGFTAYKSGNYTVYSISRQSETRSPI